jgi:hypothetical protein
MPEPSKPKRTIARATRARIGYFLGVLLIAAGLGYELGYGWGALAAGVGLVANMVLLYDVDEPEPYDPGQEVRFR